MSEDLAVRFSGDTSSLNRSIADARANLARMESGSASLRAQIAQLNTTMKAQTDAVNASTNGWRSNLQLMANVATVTRFGVDAINELARAHIEAGKHVVDMFSRLRDMNSTVNADAIKAVTGAIREQMDSIREAPGAIGAYADALANGAGAARSFIHEQEGIIASVARVVVETRSAFNQLRLDQTSAAKDVFKSMVPTGAAKTLFDEVGAGKAKEYVTELLAKIEQIPDTSDEAAKSIQTMLGSIPNYSLNANNNLINLIATISATGDEAKTNTQKLTDALKSDGAAGGSTIAEMVGKLVDNLQQSTGDAKAFANQMRDINSLTAIFSVRMNPAAASAYYAIIIKRLQDEYNAQKMISESNEAALKRLGGIGDTIAMTRNKQLQLEYQINEERMKGIALATQEKAIADRTLEAQEREKKYADTLDKAKPINAQITEVSGKIDVLQGRLDRSAALGGEGGKPTLSAQDIANMVKTIIGEAGNQSKEGQLAVASVILNRLQNGNFGSSVTDIVKADEGHQFNPWMPSKRMMTNAYDQTRPEQYENILKNIVEPLLAGKLNDPTGGALNFYAPKYTKPENQFAMDGTKKIDDQIFGTAKGSPAQIGPLTSEQVESTTQALQKAQDELKRLNEMKAGGGAVDKANLDIAQQQADGLRDQVEEAKQLVAAREKEVEASAKGTQVERDKAELGLANARRTLDDRQRAEQDAQRKIETSGMQSGTFEKASAENAPLADQLASLRQGSKEYNEILQQMISNTHAAVEQEKREQVDAENAAFDNSKRVLAEQESAIRAAAAEKGINSSQELAQLKANLTQQEALERAHQDRLQVIQGEGTKGFEKAQVVKAEIAERYRQKLLKDEEADAKKFAAMWTGEWEKIGGSVSSSLEAIIERTGNMRQLFQNVAKSIEHTMVESAVKMVADWAAQMTLGAAKYVANQAMMTAAAAAGETARTGIASAGAISAAAAKAPAMIGSILASANETFAGIFGFLSPIMGPLAAGPAAAGEAIVAAKAALPSFASGSWALPHDMVANVHAGEMIVPAGPAAMMRAAATGGAGAGGGDTHVHHSYSPTIHAIDGRGLGKILEAHSSEIIKAIDRGISLGQHLKMKNRGSL